MNGTGIIRRIDDLGRVVIPKEIRRNLGIREQDPLEIFPSSDGVFFKKYRPEVGMAEIVCDLKDRIRDNEFPSEDLRKKLLEKAGELEEILKEIAER